MEDYEKKYKEALERAKGMYEQGMMPERIEYIFPELRESEEEEIRKEIIDFVKENIIITEEQRYVWLDWLEKQKSFKWSETDDKRLSNLFGIIDSADNWNIPSKIAFKDWLQSIKKKLKGE